MLCAVVQSHKQKGATKHWLRLSPCQAALKLASAGPPCIVMLSPPLHLMSATLRPAPAEVGSIEAAVTVLLLTAVAPASLPNTPEETRYWHAL